jgi:hypothetical protein
MDRFDLEDQIMKSDNIADELEMIACGILEEQLTLDELANALIGLAIIHRIRTKNLFECFKNVFELDEYNPDSYSSDK